MNFKKRTKEEIDEAVKNGDYTGGYSWWPWLWYMRKMYVVGFLGNLAGGIAGFVTYFQDGGFVSGDPVGLGVGIFFGVLAAPLIGFLIRRDFKESKKGITR